jgi:serine/threonine protein kinase
MNERMILSRISHPFIINLHYAFQSEDSLYLILDYCPGGDIDTLLNHKEVLNETEARFYISELLLAIEELHRNGIMYRDLKPDNIVIDENGHVKLTDFGLSKYI